MKDLSIVTGGTSGIGYAIALELARNSDVVLIYHSNHEKAKDAVHSLQTQRPNAKIKAFAGHMGNTGEAKRVFRDIEQWDSRAPLSLINCAGRANISFLTTDPIESTSQVFEDNLFSVIYPTQIVARRMFKARTGRIVSLSSIATDAVAGGFSLYAAAKAGVETFTRNSSFELFGRGITINCVRPGLVRTPMTDNLIASVANEEKFLMPIEAVVATTLFFLSPGAEKITGQVFTADHGLSRMRSHD